MCVYLFFKCCTDPRQRNLPLTIMAILVQRASHSSMLNKKRFSAIIVPSGTHLYRISNHNKVRAHPLPVGGQNYSSPLLGDTEDAVPQKPFSFRVHTSGRLILYH